MQVQFLLPKLCTFLLFHVIFTQVLAMVSELVSILFTRISLFGEDMGDVEKESVELVISKLFFFLLILAVLLFRKKRKSIPRKYLCLFSLVPLLSILVVYGLADGHGIHRNETVPPLILQITL